MSMTQCQFRIKYFIIGYNLSKLYFSLSFKFAEGKGGEHHAKQLQAYCDDVERENLQGFLSDGEYQCIHLRKNNIRFLWVDRSLKMCPGIFSITFPFGGYVCQRESK